jgi:hypothetical protein
MPDATPDPFDEPVRAQMRLRCVIGGPTKSGKTLTALQGAAILAEHRGKPGSVAVIDTENGRSRLYTDTFTDETGSPLFKVNLLTAPYTPERFVTLIDQAATHGYEVIVIDSMSHEWFGPGGALDMVDEFAAKKSGNKFAAWKDVTPKHNRLLHAIMQSPCDVIVTLRYKMSYEQVTEDGQTKVRKVGLQPIQRDDVEYEFDILAEMDQANSLLALGRCEIVQGKRYPKGESAQFWNDIVGWLGTGVPMASVEQRNEIDALAVDLSDQQRTEVNAWFRERRIRMASLTYADAEATIEKLTDVLGDGGPVAPVDDGLTDEERAALEAPFDEPAPVSG